MLSRKEFAGVGPRRITMARITATDATAASERLCPLEAARRRYSGANRIARTTAQNTAPKNGQTISPKASVIATTSSVKALSRKTPRSAGAGGLIGGHEPVAARMARAPRQA